MLAAWSVFRTPDLASLDDGEAKMIKVRGLGSYSGQKETQRSNNRATAWLPRRSHHGPQPIIFGLAFATDLTLLGVPLHYLVLFRTSMMSRERAGESGSFHPPKQLENLRADLYGCLALHAIRAEPRLVTAEIVVPRGG